MTLGNVYEDTRTLLEMRFEDIMGSGYLDIRDVDSDNFGIYAHDDILDYWQVFHFGINRAEGLAAADPDGDTFNNHFEFHAQLDPLDASSRFHQTFRLDGIVGNLIYGPIRSGSTYQAWWSENLIDWQPLVGEVPDISGDFRTDFDPDAVTDAQAGRRFYRVEVKRD